MAKTLNMDAMISRADFSVDKTNSGTNRSIDNFIQNALPTFVLYTQP